jgi:hypothetical protein
MHEDKKKLDRTSSSSMADLIWLLIEERASEMEVLRITCFVLLLVVISLSSIIQADRTLSPVRVSDKRMIHCKKNAYTHLESLKPFLSPTDVKDEFSFDQSAMVGEKAQEEGKLASDVSCFRFILPTCLDEYISNVFGMSISRHTSSLFTPVAASFSTALATGNPSTTSATRLRVASRA